MRILSIHATTSIAGENFTDEADIILEDPQDIYSMEFVAVIAGVIGAIWEERYESQPMTIVYRCRQNCSTIISQIDQRSLPEELMVRTAQELLAGI